MIKTALLATALIFGAVSAVSAATGYNSATGNTFEYSTAWMSTKGAPYKPAQNEWADYRTSAGETRTNAQLLKANIDACCNGIAPNPFNQYGNMDAR